METTVTTRTKLALVCLSAVALASTPSRADVVLETRMLRLAVGADGGVRSLVAKPANTDYSWAADRGSVAAVHRGKQVFPASHVTLDKRILSIEFGKANVTATCEVTQKPDYVAIKLVKLDGKPIDRIDLLTLSLKRLPYLGTWVNVAYDDAFGICLCAGNVKTDAKMTTRKDHVVLRAIARKHVALVGTTAVLFGCPRPRETFLDTMEIVERDFGMPQGARHRRSPMQQYSYLWCSPTPHDVGEYIKWAKRGGFRMILFSYTAFSRGVGHFRWNARYPNGMADLKKVTDAIRKAGLKLGLHIHYNKAHKGDPYVTPVPDDRFHKARTFTLAAPVDKKAKTLTLSQNPKGATLDNGRRILKVGRELVAYTTFTAAPPYQFTGCQRGHIGTTPAAHKAGDKAGLLNVDTWPIFIRYDQNTDIQDETAARIGEIFKQTGPYDMVYFDGAEDTHYPTWFHCANAQWRVFRHFDPAPTLAEAAAYTHYSWHMISRGNAYDSVSPDKMKDFCREAPCRNAPRRALDFTRINFGWLHGFGRSMHRYIGPDVLEFILSRGAAWDCPFSLTISPEQLRNNPRTEDCFDVIKLWEDARIDGKITPAMCKQLKNLDQEHHLFVNEKGKHELVAIREVPKVAAGRSFKAYTFRRAAQADTLYVLIWSVIDDAALTLPVSANRLSAMKPFGKPLAVQASAGQPLVPIGDRTYLAFKGMRHEQVSDILAKSKSSAGEPTVLYLPASKFAAKVGQLELTSKTGTPAAGALGDCIVPTGRCTLAAAPGWYVDYTFALPYKGRWAVWGRMKYKDTNSNSYSVGLASAPAAKQRFGNEYVWGKWLWAEGPSLKAGAGEITIRVYARESAPKQSPLLDVLCVTNDPGYRPTDADAAKALKE